MIQYIPILAIEKQKIRRFLKKKILLSILKHVPYHDKVIRNISTTDREKDAAMHRLFMEVRGEKRGWYYLFIPTREGFNFNLTKQSELKTGLAFGVVSGD